VKAELTGGSGTKTTSQIFVSMKYPGQSHELLIAATGLHLAELSGRFDDVHKRRFGHFDPMSPVEIATIRIRVSSPSHRPIRTSTPHDAPPSREPAAVWMGGGWAKGQVCSRSDLSMGTNLDGPAVIHQMDATTLVPAGWRGHVAHDGALVIERHE
jgi:N-methylhydantoinase A